MRTAILTHRLVVETLPLEFQWGQNDCNTVVLKHVDNLIGTRFSRLLKGNYSSMLGAIKTRKKSLFTLEGFLRNIGGEYVSELKAGDIILTEGSRYQHGSIYIGEGKVFTVTPDETGVSFLPNKYIGIRI